MQQINSINPRSLTTSRDYQHTKICYCCCCV